MANTEQVHNRRVRIRNLVIRIVLVLAFAWLVLLAVENLVIPAMTNQYISLERGEQMPSNVGLSFIVSEEFEIPLEMHVLQSLRQEYGESAVGLVLSGASLSGIKLGATAEQVCLTKLWVEQPLPFPEYSPVLEVSTTLAEILNEIPVTNELSMAFNDFCVERGGVKVRASDLETPLVGVLPFATGAFSILLPL